MFEKKSACGLFQEDIVVGEIVDDPKVPQTQMPKERSACGSLQEDTVMPEEQSACGSFQDDTVVAEIVDDPKVCHIDILLELSIGPPDSSARGTVSLQFILEVYCCGRNC